MASFRGVFITTSAVTFIFTASVHASCRALPAVKAMSLIKPYARAAVLNIVAGSKPIGLVIRKTVDKQRMMSVTDLSGSDKIMSSEETSYAWGTEMIIFDCENAKMGSLKERVFLTENRRLISYALYDAEGEWVARTDLLPTGATEFEFLDGSGKKIATFTRSESKTGDRSWTAAFDKGLSIRAELLMMAAAFKASAEGRPIR